MSLISQKILQAVIREHRAAAIEAHAKSRLIGTPYFNYNCIFRLVPMSERPEAPAPKHQTNRIAVVDWATDRLIGTFSHREDAEKAIGKAIEAVQKG